MICNPCNNWKETTSISATTAMNTNRQESNLLCQVSPLTPSFPREQSYGRFVISSWGTNSVLGLWELKDREGFRLGEKKERNTFSLLHFTPIIFTYSYISTPPTSTEVHLWEPRLEITIYVLLIDWKKKQKKKTNSSVRIEKRMMLMCGVENFKYMQWKKGSTLHIVPWSFFPCNKWGHLIRLFMAAE